MLAAAVLFVAPAGASEATVHEATSKDDEPPPSGMRLALRSGFAVPVGQAFNGSGALIATIDGQIPLRVDVGYRIHRHIYVGGVGQLALVVPGSCPSGGSCSGTSGRFGAMVAYHALPTSRIDPWLGLGMGFEILNVSRSLGTSSVDVSMRGLELLNVDLGVDVRSRALRIGPVVSASIGRFTSVTVNDTSTSDFHSSTHAWLMLGLRGAYDL